MSEANICEVGVKGAKARVGTQYVVQVRVSVWVGRKWSVSNVARAGAIVDRSHDRSHCRYRISRSLL